jgi:hypothetical protein
MLENLVSFCAARLRQARDQLDKAGSARLAVVARRGRARKARATWLGPTRSRCLRVATWTTAPFGRLPPGRLLVLATHRRKRQSARHISRKIGSGATRRRRRSLIGYLRR